MTKQLIIESKKYGTHAVLIDEEDWEKVKGYRWCLSRHHTGRFYVKAYAGTKNTEFTIRKNGYRQKKEIKIRLHRLIMDAKKGQIVDHIDGDSLNNTKANLRFATITENNANRKMASTNKSGYRGVHRANGRRPFVAQISHKNKKINLGAYNTPEEAARAYDAAVKKYRGESVTDRQLNFPDKNNQVT